MGVFLGDKTGFVRLHGSHIDNASINALTHMYIYIYIYILAALYNYV